MDRRPIRLVLRSGQAYDIDQTFIDANGEECNLADQYGVGIARLFRSGQRVTVRTEASTVVIVSDEIAAVEMGETAATRSRGSVSSLPSSRRAIASV
ncbi:MAG: hypothetical protein KY469_16320 [Actinobacteria bacterium]|nr:hypothetical protein [Actinomycetota bacterium]